MGQESRSAELEVLLLGGRPIGNPSPGTARS